MSKFYVRITAMRVLDIYLKFGHDDQYLTCVLLRLIEPILQWFYKDECVGLHMQYQRFEKYPNMDLPFWEKKNQTVKLRK